MPLCTLLAPHGLTDAAKSALMQKMDADIHQAYPMYGTYIFITETQRTDSMLDGTLLLDNGDSPPRDGRICTLRCPPGASADSKKAMMAGLSEHIAEAYPNAGTVFVILEEDDLGSVMINGLLQSEDPRNKQPA
jgi:phenylpyruvate tautomerase PptA (4-oxalocrotonate tautomerase family)